MAKKPKLRELPSDEVPLFEGLEGMLDALDRERKVQLLQTFMLLMSCTDAATGRLYPDRLERLVARLSDGKLKFERGGSE